jgi:putative lipoprotein
MAEAPIRETAWRFLSIGGEEVALSEERREPVLRLRGGADPRFTATVGCNTVTGGFDLGEGTLAFRPGPTTLMACTPELDALERRMISALEATQGYATDAGVLDLLDSGGRVLARLQAVYVP